MVAHKLLNAAHLQSSSELLMLLYSSANVQASMSYSAQHDTLVQPCCLIAFHSIFPTLNACDADALSPHAHKRAQQKGGFHSHLLMPCMARLGQWCMQSTQPGTPETATMLWRLQCWNSNCGRSEPTKAQDKRCLFQHQAWHATSAAGHFLQFFQAL